MIFFGILWIVLGVALAGVGYLITFRKKYAFIINFIEDRANGTYDTAYAKRTGMLAILWGIILILTGILILAVHSVGFTIAACIISLVLTAATLILHGIFSIKNI